MKFAFRAATAFCLLLIACCDIPAHAQPLVTHVVTGQIVIAVTGTAVQLPRNDLQNGVVIKALSTNTACGAVGGSAVTNVCDGTGNGYIVLPGEPTPGMAVPNTNLLYINGTAGDIFTFEGN